MMFNMKKQRLKRIIWLLCMSVTLAACGDKAEIEEVVRTIKTITVSEQAADRALKFSGVVAAVDSSGLSFQVGGNVSSVHVDIGDRVEKGDTLAVLDPEPYQLEVDAVGAELVKARSDVAKSKAQYERHKRIFEQGAGAKSYLDVAASQYNSAKSAVSFQMARLDLARRDLRKTKLIAPYDGTIAWRSVQPHEEVVTGQAVFEINATGEIEVNIAVPETTIDRIQVNEAATITFPTLPDKSTRGYISYIGSAAVEANTFPVKVVLMAPDEKIKPGMTAVATLTIKDETQTPGFMIPLQALLPAPEPNRAFVFVYDPGTSTVRKTRVRAHGVELKKAVVKEGLSAGDVIAVAGVSFLADGMKVKLMEQ